MKLSLYMPNFRDEVTVKEIVDLALLAENLDFDSIWTLDRIVVPASSDTGEMQCGFGNVPGQPRSLPVSSKGSFLHGLPLVPYLAALTKTIRLGTSIIVTPYRAPGVLAAELATVDNLSNGRLNVGVGAGWMPEEFAVANASHIYAKKGRHMIETIEVMKGVWTQEHFEYEGQFASFEKCGFGKKPVQQNPHPPIFMGGIARPDLTAKRINKYDLEGWIGSHNMPEDINKWRTEIAAEFNKMETSRSVDDLTLCSMTPFAITDERSDQTPLMGTVQQVTDNLKRFKEAGLTMPILWPPFSGTPTSKTMDDLNRLKNDIMPKVDEA